MGEEKGAEFLLIPPYIPTNGRGEGRRASQHSFLCVNQRKRRKVHISSTYLTIDDQNEAQRDGTRFIFYLKKSYQIISFTL
jgi:hypothetical protein